MESQLIIGDKAHDHTLVASPSESELSNYTLVALPSELKLASGLQNLYVTPQALPLCTPGGSKEWIPGSRPELKPVLWMKFLSVDEGIELYKAYDLACGFNIRKSTTTRKNVYGEKKGVVAFKYCLCNKAGFKEKRRQLVEVKSVIKEGENEGVHSQVGRRRLVTRVGCRAQMVLKLSDDGCYVVINSYEGHSHVLYTPTSRKFQKGARKLTILHKKVIVDNLKLKVGLVKTYRMYKEHVEGYDNIAASKQDFKKNQRDLKAYIEGSDAQMFVDNFKMKKLLWSAYFYDFEVDEDDCLCRAFWADPICRRNYALFGDMMSFDTTYQFNKYNMIFGPFTGVDHHKKCITFVGSFIAKEDTSSFEWVFTTFLKAMGHKEPVCLITDQDPAKKIAIEKVFVTAEHRFCMWHIMKKLLDKVGRQIAKDTDFLEKLSGYVWSLELGA